MTALSHESTTVGQYCDNYMTMLQFGDGASGRGGSGSQHDHHHEWGSAPERDPRHGETDGASIEHHTASVTERRNDGERGKQSRWQQVDHVL